MYEFQKQNKELKNLKRTSHADRFRPSSSSSSSHADRAPPLSSSYIAQARSFYFPILPFSLVLFLFCFVRVCALSLFFFFSTKGRFYGQL